VPNSHQDAEDGAVLANQGVTKPSQQKNKKSE
jgi:hypothetical protein